MLLAIVYVPILFAYAGYSHTFELLVKVARWPLLALVVLIFLALLYRYGPCRRSAKWRWVSVGSLFATVMWLIASAGFSFYVSNFAHYDRTYGSLGAVIVLLFWLYISFYIVLRRRRDQRRARTADGAGHHTRQIAAASASAVRSSPTTWREESTARSGRQVRSRPIRQCQAARRNG